MKQQNVSLINEFKENLKCFKDRTSYITFFDLKDCEFFPARIFGIFKISPL